MTSCCLNANEIVRIGTQDSLVDRTFYAEFESLYAQHGYQIIWVTVPVERAVLEALSGNLDANLYVTALYEGLEDAGYLAFSNRFDIELIVICSVQVDCSQTALLDEKAIFIGPSLANKVRSRLGYHFRFEQVEDVKNYIKMIVSGRYHYALALGHDSIYSTFPDNVQYFVIEKIQMHHFISKHRKDIYQALTTGDK